MKKFFALWVVSLVFATITGVIIGVIEYSIAPIVSRSDGAWTCVDTLLGGCFSDPIDIFVAYSFSAFAIMIIAYPVFRVVVGSFKVVFSKNEN